MEITYVNQKKITFKKPFHVFWVPVKRSGQKYMVDAEQHMVLDDLLVKIENILIIW